MTWYDTGCVKCGCRSVCAQRPPPARRAGHRHHVRGQSRHFYSLNREHLAAPHILGLCQLRNQLRQRVADLVDAWVVPAEVVILFGSAARGEMRPASDIDLFVLRPPSVDDDVWLEQAAILAERVSAWTGNDARVLEMTPEEARDGLAEGNGVLLAVRDEGQTLFGDPRYMHKLRTSRKGPTG